MHLPTSQPLRRALPQALATGVVNSFMSSGGTGYDSKVWESLDHFYDVQAWIPKDATLVNKAAFNALDKATQDESIAFCEKLFAGTLRGYPLMTNARHLRGSAWLNFQRVKCEQWWLKNEHGAHLVGAGSPAVQTGDIVYISNRGHGLHI